MYDATERLMTLPSFRDFIERKNAEAAAKAAAEATARARAETECSSLASALIQYFTVKNDEPSVKVCEHIRACGDPAVLTVWLGRAYNGETSAQIFGGRSGS